MIWFARNLGAYPLPGLCSLLICSLDRRTAITDKPVMAVRMICDVAAEYADYSFSFTTSTISHFFRECMVMKWLRAIKPSTKTAVRT